LFELFQIPGAIYFIAELKGKLVGGAGIYPTKGLPEKTCELVKLYLHKDARGIGLGKQLLLKSMQWAKENGYEQVYLESMPELSKAVSIYENVGFKQIHHALGNSGHDGCDIWMIKNL
jgi:putative acetyltransferase